MVCDRALAISAFAACSPVSPVFDMRAAMSPATSGVENDVPLQQAMPSKSRHLSTFGGSVHRYRPFAKALTSPSPGAKTSTHGP